VNRRIVLSASLAVTLATVQLATVRLSPSDVPVRIVLPLTIALAPLALWPHRKHLGVWVIFVGLAANLAAITANGGLMPIERDTVAQAAGADRAAGYAEGAWIEGSKDVLVGPGDGRALALGDAIVVRAGGGGLVVSAGDIVIGAGIVILVAEAAALAWFRPRRPPLPIDPSRVRAYVAARAGDGAPTPQ
jgi:hypothetical protein